MDAKEVISHVANIDKAVREKLPPKHLLDLLTSLKTGVNATEKLLRVGGPDCVMVSFDVYRRTFSVFIFSNNA